MPPKREAVDGTEGPKNMPQHQRGERFKPAEERSPLSTGLLTCISPTPHKSAEVVLPKSIVMWTREIKEANCAG